MLIEKTNMLQDEYLTLLQGLLEYSNEINVPLSAIDEIVLFWMRKIELVKMYLSYEFSNRDSYVFTATTFMDLSDNEQYPFLLIGKYHIFDDPLCRYAEIYNKMVSKGSSEGLTDQIISTIEDNIRILKECNSYILIMPLRLLNQDPKNNNIFEMGEKLFINLFNNINNLNDYFEKCVTMTDILTYLRKDVTNGLVFTENDDMSLPLEKRYSIAKENLSMINNMNSDGENFFYPYRW